MKLIVEVTDTDKDADLSRVANAILAFRKEPAAENDCKTGSVLVPPPAQNRQLAEYSAGLALAERGTDQAILRDLAARAGVVNVETDGPVATNVDEVVFTPSTDPTPAPAPPAPPPSIAPPPPPPGLATVDTASIGFGAGNVDAPSGDIDPAIAPPPPNALGDDTTTAPDAPSSGQLVDDLGMPWDDRIHSGGKTKVKSGAWRMKSGVDAEVVKRVEAELRVRMAQANTNENGIPAPPPPSGEAPPPPAPASPAMAEFTALAQWIGPYIITDVNPGGHINSAEIAYLCKRAGVVDAEGNGKFSLLATQSPEKIAEVRSNLLTHINANGAQAK